MTPEEARAKLIRYPAIRFVPGGSGRTVFGNGTALLPEATPWPEYEGAPMLLLARIDLAEVAAAVPDLAREIPAGGVLQVFMGEELGVDDNAAEDNPLLLFFPPEISLTEKPPPSRPYWDESDPLSMRAVGMDTYAEPEDLTPEEERDPAIEDALAPDPPAHAMLGVPKPIQDPPVAYEAGKTLILQLDSDDALDWGFGDEGALYFLADGDAWREGRLEAAVYEFQCH